MSGDKQYEKPSQDESQQDIEYEQDIAKVMKTNTGNGYKLVLNGKWLYCSKTKVEEMITGETKTCTFREIEEGDYTGGAKNEHTYTD